MAHNTAIQTVDLNYIVGGDVGSKGPIIRMFGITATGNSVLAHIRHVMPYFYVPCWEGFAVNDATVFGEALTVRLLKRRGEEMCLGFL
jgi:hypothetical protein